MKKLLLVFTVALALIMTVTVLAEDNGADQLIQNDTSYVQGDVMAIADDLADAPTTSLRYAPDGTPLFADIDYTNDTFASSVSVLAKAGIVDGFPDGTFRPQNGLTRAEFCKMVNMIFGYTESDSEAFIDISREDIHCWFYDIAMVAKKAGYIKGYEDNSFRGDNQLTREETCTVLNRILSLYALPLPGMEITDAVSDWAVNDVNAVVTNFLMPLEEGNTFRATEIIKRSEVIVVLANLYTAHQEELEKEEESSSGSSSSGSGSSGSGSSDSGSSDSGSSGSDDDDDNNSEDNTDDGNGEDNTDDNNGEDNTDNNNGEDNTDDNNGEDNADDDNSEDNTDDDKEMTREEIDAANAEVLAHLKTARTDIQSIVINATEYSIVKLFLDGFDGVTADAQAGILITPEYVNEAYADKINEAVEIYEAMNEWDQGNFRDKLVSGIDTQAMSFLLDYFPLEYFL